MATLYYSKISKGFYNSDIHSIIPEDAVEISTEVWQNLLNAQANGKTIDSDVSGNPIAVDPPTPSAAELWFAYQTRAKAALEDSDMVAIRCLKAGVTFPPDWWVYVELLRDIVRAESGDPTVSLPTAPTYPEGT